MYDTSSFNIISAKTPIYISRPTLRYFDRYRPNAFGFRNSQRLQIWRLQQEEYHAICSTSTVGLRKDNGTYISQCTSLNTQHRCTIHYSTALGTCCLTGHCAPRKQQWEWAVSRVQQSSRSCPIVHKHITS